MKLVNCVKWKRKHFEKSKIRHTANMSVITLKISHLCIFTLLVLQTISHVIQEIPLCGTMDGSLPPKENDKIYFKDNQGIRTVQVNGSIIACYPDGTMVDTKSSGETIDATSLDSRIREGDAKYRWIEYVHFEPLRFRC